MGVKREVNVGVIKEGIRNKKEGKLKRKLGAMRRTIVLKINRMTIVLPARMGITSSLTPPPTSPAAHGMGRKSSSAGVHPLVVGLIVRAADGLHPVAMLKIPKDGLLYAHLEARLRVPAQVGLDA